MKCTSSRSSSTTLHIWLPFIYLSLSHALLTSLLLVLNLFVSKGNHDISRFHSEQKMCWGKGSGEVAQEESGRRNAQGREPRRRNPNSHLNILSFLIRWRRSPATIQTLGRQLSQKAYTTTRSVDRQNKERRLLVYPSVMKRSWREKLDWVGQFPFCNMSSPLSVLYDTALSCAGPSNKKKRKRVTAATAVSASRSL